MIGGQYLDVRPAEPRRERPGAHLPAQDGRAARGLRRLRRDRRRRGRGRTSHGARLRRRARAALPDRRRRARRDRQRRGARQAAGSDARRGRRTFASELGLAGAPRARRRERARSPRAPGGAARRGARPRWVPGRPGRDARPLDAARNAGSGPHQVAGTADATHLKPVHGTRGTVPRMTSACRSRSRGRARALRVPIPDNGGVTRLDQLLCERGLAETRSRAQALVMAGRVRVDGRVVTKAGTAIARGAALEVEHGPRASSRAAATSSRRRSTAFAIDVSGLACLDVGASTGGFTDCLLQARRGARDRARRRPRPAARALLRDDRVTLLEGVNARLLAPGDLPGPPATLAVVDVSFISLALVLPPRRRLLARPYRVLPLVKPQFEAGRAEVRRGVVRDPAVHAAVLERVAAVARDAGGVVLGACESGHPGPAGNREFFLHVVSQRPPGGRQAPRPTRSRCCAMPSPERLHACAAWRCMARRAAGDAKRARRAPGGRGRRRAAAARGATSRERRPRDRARRRRLRAARAAAGDRARGMPVLGVNFGRVGFLTTARADELETGRARARSPASYGSSSSRPSQVEREGERVGLAVNDVVVASDVQGRIARLGWKVERRRARRARLRRRDRLHARRLDRLRALGRRARCSTGASRALGVTFVAPHTLTARPLVLPRGARVEVANARASSTVARDPRRRAERPRARAGRVGHGLARAGAHRARAAPRGRVPAALPRRVHALMLEELVVENLVLVRSARLALHPGLNVLTGETGAGKTILAEARRPAARRPRRRGARRAGRRRGVRRGDVLGRRAARGARRSSRPRTPRASLVARRVGREGRSRALLYGRSCTRDDLERIGAVADRDGLAARGAPARRARRCSSTCSTLARRGAVGAARATWRRPGAALAAARRALADAEAGAADEQRAARPSCARSPTRSTSVDPQPGEEDDAARASATGCATSTRCSRPRRGGRRAAQPRRGRRRRWPLAGEAAHALERACASTTRRSPRSRDDLARIAEELREAARRAALATCTGLDADPAGLDRVEERLEQLADLRRRFGASTRPPSCGRAPRRRARELAEGERADERGSRARPRSPRQRPSRRRHACGAAQGGAARRRSRSRGASSATSPTWAWRARALEVALAAAPLGARGARRRRAAPGRQPGAARRPARQRGLGRRALAHRAGGAAGGARPRRRRRCSSSTRSTPASAAARRASLDRQAARARRDGAGALHHAPAADRGGADRHFLVEKTQGATSEAHVAQLDGRRGARGARAHARRRRGRRRRPGARDQPARRGARLTRTGDAARGAGRPDGGAMRSLRSGMPRRPPAAAARRRALGRPAPAALPGRALRRADAGGSVSFVVRSSQITGLQVRMPLSCRNTPHPPAQRPDAGLRRPPASGDDVLAHLPPGRRQRERLVRRRRQRAAAGDLPLAAVARRLRARQRARPQPGRA